MAIEDIKKDLEKRFAEPLPEFYKRRIIFWNDEDGDFKDEIENFQLDSVKTLILTETNQFISKRLLSSQDLDSNYLVYNSLKYSQENDWFLDIKLYSEEYRSDKTSLLMQEMNIPTDLADARTIIQNYKEFFNAKSRRNAIINLNKPINNRNDLFMSMLAVVCGDKQVTPESIIKSFMKGGKYLDNTIWNDLQKFSLSNRFWQLVSRYIGYSTDIFNNDMFYHIVLSAISRTVNDDVLKGLEDRYSYASNGFCYDLINNWAYSDDNESLHNILNFVDDELRLYERFSNFEIDQLVSTKIIPVIDEVIIKKLIEGIVNNTVKYDEIISVLEKRKTSAWIKKYDHFYNGILYAAEMNKFSINHANDFHFVDAKIMWKAYTNELYLMDTYYRNFHNAFSVCLNNITPLLDDEFKNLADYVEKLYDNWYLSNLSENWTKVIEEEMATIGYIPNINQQKDFYKNEISKKDTKVFVIISDALRYEVAVSLKDKLSIETNCDIRMDSQQAIFPTITKYGMAALLPHKQLSLNDKLDILVDGKRSEMSDRETILKSAKDNSVVVRYKDLLTMKRTERRDLVKGKDVIYIYHDTIDAAGHEETKVFEACDNTIDEIKNIVNIVISDLQGGNILITADHGFLYTYSPLNEDDKLDRASFKNEIKEQGRRFVLTNSSNKPDYLMSVKGFYEDSNIYAYAPKENIRIKGGSGLNFVHGGLSLQEMVVPIIRYKFLRNSNKTYQKNRDKYDTKPVSVALLSSTRKISNMIFNLSFYQKEAVANNYISATYDIYLADKDGLIVSDTQRIIADKTATSANEREFKLTFNLKQQKYNNSELYYLTIVDNGRTNIPQKEEFTIDIAMAIDDFNFFD